ncbi:MAG: hypothetical protein ACM3TN_25015 [Alphaproteobacteria bacterium]
MVAALQLNGKGEPTQKAYTRAVRMLSEFYDQTPDLISKSPSPTRASLPSTTAPC